MKNSLLLLLMLFISASIYSQTTSRLTVSASTPRDTSINYFLSVDNRPGFMNPIRVLRTDSLQLSSLQITRGLGFTPYNLTNPNGYINKTQADNYYKAITYVPAWTDVTGKPSFFSGNYNDLTNKPTIPTVKRQETYSGVTNSSGVYSVSFPIAYSVAPNIQANIINATDTQNIRITSISTTGATVAVRNRVDVIGLLPSWTNVNGANVDILVTEK